MNTAYEAKLPKERKPQKEACLDTRDAFIKAKYRERDFFEGTKYQPGPLIETDLRRNEGCEPAVSSFGGFGDEDLFSNSKRHLFDSDEEAPEKTDTITIMPLQDEETKETRRRRSKGSSRSRSRSSSGLSLIHI